MLFLATGVPAPAFAVHCRRHRRARDAATTKQDIPDVQVFSECSEEMGSVLSCCSQQLELVQLVLLLLCGH
jgi:hypothetical protein